MSEMFQSIMQSFDETIHAAKSGSLKETLFVVPLRNFDADSIRHLRQRMGMTQSIFAGVFGVSKKTVEAWESGRNVPSGPSLRMMALFSEDVSIAERFLSQQSKMINAL